MYLQVSKLGLYQKWLKKKFQDIETLYYSEVDELTQKLGDADLPGVKPEDFTLTEFSFITQWEDGLIGSAKVYEIMLMMNDENAAKAKIIKKLQNYMFKYEDTANYIKPVIEKLNGECVDLMIQYLVMMRRFFKKMTEVDESQISVSWVQQFFKDKEIHDTVTEEMSLNQTIKHIDAFIHEVADQRFYLSDQVIVFHEDVGVNDHAIHWIFAPRCYIELLRVLFGVKELLGKDETEFLKLVIKEVE